MSRNSLLCPNCRRLISANEDSCPYCGLKNPDSWWKNNIWVRARYDTDSVTKAIIGINVIMFILSIIIDPGKSAMALSPFQFLSPSNRSLILLGATGAYPIDNLHRWWSLLSANYLHGGLLHILFNMLVFRQLAPLAANEFGLNRMITIYTGSGVAGYLLSYVIGIPFTIGASAAVTGLMGAIIYYGKSRGGHYGQAIYSQVGVWAIAIFVFGFLVPGINNWGHGGGMLAGALLGYLLGYTERKKETFFDRIAAALCIGTTLLVLTYAVITALYYVVSGVV